MLFDDNKENTLPLGLLWAHDIMEYSLSKHLVEGKKEGGREREGKKEREKVTELIS